MVDRREKFSSDKNQNTSEIQVDFDLKKCLVFTSKGSLKWLGSLEELKQVFYVILNVETNWATPRGGCKQYENSALDIRWYITSKSLIIKAQRRDHTEV